MTDSRAVSRLWFFSIVAMTIVTWSFCAADDSFPIVKSAYQTSTESLRSGHGKGTFAYLEKKPGAAEWEVVSKAAVEVYFDNEKYHVDLDYARDRMMGTKRSIIVHDGSAIRASRFSPRISPTGASGSIFSPGKRDANAVLAGFSFDVARMEANFLNVPACLEKIDEKPITVRTSDEGDYFWSSQVNKRVSVVYQFSKKYGHNIASMVVKNGDTVATEKTARWNQRVGVWCMDFFSKASLSANEKSRMWTLEYDSFEPNVEVDPAMFTPGALRLGAARVIDHRPKAKRGQSGADEGADTDSF